MKNQKNFGWVASADGSKKADIILKYPKSETLKDLALFASFALAGLLLHEVCKDMYFQGANAYMETEIKALESIDVMK